MTATLTTTRRGFLAGMAASGAVLTVGFNPVTGALAHHGGPEDLNPFVRVYDNGTVAPIIKHFEMGQGTTTGLATLVAEELDADWDQVVPEFAPANDAVYQNLLFGTQGTGGSTAIANSFEQYRKAGAAARAMLVQAAANAWGVPVAGITVENGVIRAGDRQGRFGDFVTEAARLTPPADPALKPASAFTLIGLDGLKRKDTAAKTDGSAIFAIDVRVEGMVHALILRSPRFGGTLVSFDATRARSVPGFLDAKALPNGAGVAVFGKTTWAAKSARDAITADWDFSRAETRSTAELVAYHQALMAEPQYQARPGQDPDTVAAALATAAQVIEADYVFPNLAHAPMEPLNCVIAGDGQGGVIVHDGCQFPGLSKPTVAQVLGLDPDQVQIRTVYAGGAFGRRATPSSDYQAEAAMAFDLLGRTTPVKLVWMREDDIQGGYYRPMATHRARIGLNADGTIIGWDHRIAAKPILKGTIFEPFLVHDGVDHTSVEGIGDTPYAIDNLAVGLSDAETPVTVLWWRAVGHTHNAYAMETLIDQVAEAAGMDPVQYRLERLLADPANTDHRRLSGVLRLAAEKAGWGQPVAPGHARGVSLHKSFNSYVAQVVEVAVDDRGAMKVVRVDCAIDCGVIVNPDVVRAQVEGGIGYGLGAVMRNAITFTDGYVDQLNFPDYEPLRISDMPAIHVHMVPSTASPTGVGEPGTPPIGPALANAIYAATGRRIRVLPMTQDGAEFV